MPVLLPVKKCLFIALVSLLPLFSYGAAAKDSLAMRIMEQLYSKSESSGLALIESNLYLKQNVEVERKNILVSMFPNMTLFDKGEKSYLSEFVYWVEQTQSALPKMRRLSAITTFANSSGELDCVLDFMTPQLCGERLFNNEYLSPFSSSNRNLYEFSLDTAWHSPGTVRIVAVPRFRNIQLLASASAVVDEADFSLRKIEMQGWNEQFNFKVAFGMAGDSGMPFVAGSVSLDIDYSFAGNRMAISAEGVFDHKKMLPRAGRDNAPRGYNIGVSSFVADGVSADLQTVQERRLPLSRTDSLLYMRKGVMLDSGKQNGRDSLDNDRGVKAWLWRVGDEAISSHTLAWGGSDLRISPLVNPSYLSYSTSKGLSYKLSMNLRTRFGKGMMLQMKPMVGYNFKYGEFYWGVNGEFSFAPMKRGALAVDAGRGNSVYSSMFLDAIKNASLDSLDFSTMPLLYYRDAHLRVSARVEPINGLELHAGATLYKRSLYGNASAILLGSDIQRHYRQLAPHFRAVWHPGMYYYIADGRKVNIGSRAPRIALDVEQGVSGIFGSQGVYTRAELDVQHKRRISSSASLYLRAGAGGYFHTKDIYFVNYAFLKDNPLPLDKEDDENGVFQLLDREWYSSANKYLRLNACCTSPFMLLQRVVPKAGFIKNENLYAGLLFISHLCPYWECGYGVETPYIDAGVFVGFENERFGRVGCKVSFSLFN